MATAQVPTAQPPAEATFAAEPAVAPLHHYKEIKGAAGAINGLFMLLLIVLFAGLAANIFLFVALRPDEVVSDLVEAVDRRLFLILPFQLVLFGLIFATMVFWLYRACGNQRSFGAERLRLAPAELLALCFVPVANLFAIKVALADIWRTADLKVVPGDAWRNRPVPRRLNVVWIGPLLTLAVNIGSAIVVNDRIERDGNDAVSTVAEADFVYARNAISILVGMIVLNAIRKVFFDTSERQHSVMRQLRAGGGRARERPGQRPPLASQVHTAR